LPTSKSRFVAESALYRLILSPLCVLVLGAIRAAIPQMFALLALEWLGRELILRFIPLLRVGTPGGPAVTHVLFVLTVVGLGLAYGIEAIAAALSGLSRYRKVHEVAFLPIIEA
jgi:hypothetical protein